MPSTLSPRDPSTPPRAGHRSAFGAAVGRRAEVVAALTAVAEATTRVRGRSAQPDYAEQDEKPVKTKRRQHLTRAPWPVDRLGQRQEEDRRQAKEAEPQR